MEPSPSMLVEFLQLGFSAAAALAGGFFIILLIKYILESVVGQANTLHSMISQLDNRVTVSYTHLTLPTTPYV